MVSDADSRCQITIYVLWPEREAHFKQRDVDAIEADCGNLCYGH